jgi:hypothetical protein
MATEFEEQREVVAWFREKWPQHQKSLRLSLNGLNLGGGKKAAMIINQIKSQGAVLGEADLVILMPRMGYGALVIEHKAENDKKGPSDEQLDYIGYHNMIGNKALVTKGVQQFKDAILEYMNNKEEQ